MKKRVKFVSFIATLLVVFPLFSSAQSASHQMIFPEDLKWVDVPSLPLGAKAARIEGSPAEPSLYTVRVKYPPNYQIPAHSHPTTERLTVISGTVYMGMGDKLDLQKSTAMPAGSIMILQANNNHFLWTKDEAIIQSHGIGPFTIVYVNPTDDPRKK